MRAVFDCTGIRMNSGHNFVSAFARLAGGRGGQAPDFTFAKLDRLRQWKNGRIENMFSGEKQISATENPNDVFSLAC